VYEREWRCNWYGLREKSKQLIALSVKASHAAIDSALNSDAAARLMTRRPWLQSWPGGAA